GIGLLKRSAQHGEILGENEDGAPVNAPEAGDQAVSRHPLTFEAEIVHPVRHQLVPLLKAPRVHQRLNSFPGQQFALFMLPFPALRAASVFGLALAAFQLSLVVGGHRSMLPQGSGPHPLYEKWNSASRILEIRSPSGKLAVGISRSSWHLIHAPERVLPHD